MNETFFRRNGFPEGKVIIITGASRGLGRALALRFAKKKAALGICSRDNSRLTQVIGELEELNCRFIAQSFDLRDEQSSKHFADSVVARFGKVDVLINSASALGPRVDVASYPSQAWKEVIEVNLYGVFFLTKQVLPLMKAQQSGSIINVNSSVGRVGRKDWGAYAVSKFGIEGLTQVVADEVKSLGIRVNSVNPGPMATDMRQEAYPAEDQTKLKKPEDNLQVFFYLSSDESKSMTGKMFDAQQFQR